MITKLTIFIIIFQSISINYYEPEQVHISLGYSDDEMIVTWAAPSPSQISYVEYEEYKDYKENLNCTGKLKFMNRAKGTWNKFPNLDYPHIFQKFLFTCNAVMANLSLGQIYIYRVGSDEFGWSKNFKFRAKRDFSKGGPAKVIVYGDLGISPENDITVDTVLDEVDGFEVDAVIHNGDFAYDFNSRNGKKGDTFMQEIEPIASKVPYMVSIGNHEKGVRILHYYYRFTMPSNSLNQFYSFNIGPIHFLSYSTELIFDNWWDFQSSQEAFIKSDLSSYNRTAHPWLVVFGHRPLYCSAQQKRPKNLPRLKPPLERHNSDCLVQAPLVRSTFEKYWKKFKVDLVVSSHVHAYERLRPVFNGKVVGCDIEEKHFVVGCKGPVLVVSGNPGQDESYAPVSTTPLEFSVAQDDHVGFGRITAVNHTHLLWEQVRSNSSEVTDFVWIIKKGWSNQ